MTSLTVRSPQFRDRRDGAVPVATGEPELRAVRQHLHIPGHRLRALHRLGHPAGAAPHSPIAAVAEEADLFVRQEAQHARAHRAHAKAMIAQYPGLEETYAAANAAYDELLEREDVEFHLAYIANLEATFTPLFKMVLDNRHELFDGSDERVGTLLLWHFVEEIEHRSSALAHPPPCHPGPLVSYPQGTQGLRPRRRHLQARAGWVRGARSARRSPHLDEGRRPERTVPLGAARSFLPRPAANPSVDAEPRPWPGPADDALARDQSPDATARPSSTNRCRCG